MNNEKVTVTLELNKDEARALAQFVKRTSHSDCEDKATSQNEAYLMMDGVNAVMKSLAEEGISPR
ncbi:hypothetical protein MUA04_01705 [Enterobacteriaceae bacterium H11S18]|uniref:DUF7706 family protein n=1 Tax=Dryocola clanedunensis TaxID=2925396 RepID=UPI0022F00A6F|nr:hypothetical protein [Dryocola clanedunensis]MCT4708935.1 hypothetical protein [Dryocola clanedunensis]